MIKEACVESFSEAKAAYLRGADRIELCENLYVGGTTPSYGTVKACQSLPIPTFVMVRPRGGDFCYSKEEIEIMKEDILLFLKMKVDGLVFGFLNSASEIDYPLLKEILELIEENKEKETSITFHKAIDEVSNPKEDILKLASLKVTRVLTSGKQTTALEGKDLLNEMIELGRDKITIVVAGRVKSDNLHIIKEEIKNSEYHGKLIV